MKLSPHSSSCYTQLFCHDESPNRASVNSLGGKAAKLIELQTIGQRVPPFYVITTEAFRSALERAGLLERIAQKVGSLVADPDGQLASVSAEIREWIRGVELPPELKSAIDDHEWTRSQLSLAVRSSAVGEDGDNRSFAGLYASFIDVRGSGPLERAIKDVWASAYSESALAYRLAHRLSFDSIAIAVIVQQAIAARTSGIVFTVHPTTQDVHSLLIHSVLGAGEELVAGALDPDCFTVDKNTRAVRCDLPGMTEQYQCQSRGNGDTHKVPWGGSARSPSSLSPQNVQQLVQAGLEIERHFGRPQDVEFAFDGNGRLFILQARPITTAVEYGPAANNRLVWDNSNIIESYFGVTSPMTFSFIRRAYTIVYYCFAEVMGISPKVIQRNKHTFENMLGLFRGRVYYNLHNWFRLLRLFPGFHYNSQFMQSMMGLKEPVELREQDTAPGVIRRYCVELPALIRLIVRSMWNFVYIRHTVRQFNGKFERYCRQWRAIDFSSQSPHELMSLYRSMEETLLWDWKAPIVNDFYVMVFCGVLRKLCKSWCGDQSGSLANDLLCGEGDIASTEPTRLLLRLASIAEKDPELKRLIAAERPEMIAAKVTGNPRFASFTAMLEQYLELYGARRTNELKLEEPSLRDDPRHLFLILRNYLTMLETNSLGAQPGRDRERMIRRDAELRVRRAFRRTRDSSYKLAFFQWVLKNARMGTKNREQMRFARTRIYDILRNLLHAIAKHLVAEKILHDRDDIFYLTLDEVWDFIKGTAVTTNLSELVALRQREFEEYRRNQAAAPDSRFETYGMAYHRNRFKNRAARNVVEPPGGGLHGTPCSSGSVTGRVCVVTAPEVDTPLAGDILVAERTDPGWIPLYPTVAGILIERGSILSHSAIVAREMGIPTIVGIPGLLARLRTGDQVTMDGSTGSVNIRHS
jgi:pyruvate,water dikinase